ncbi:MAG: hypothetical protein LAT82_02575 [Nanoarchaeota archaeon]|nr:hypothetical protein [Nanoarchaeota archaeon]
MTYNLGHKITELKHIYDLFEMINSKLVGTSSKLNIYLIGGGALMFYNAKASTKDLDIIVTSNSDLELIENILFRLGFKEKILTIEYKNFELDKMFELDDYRLDIFNQKVCGKLGISERMISRAKIELSLSNLKLCILSKEDIFVFKSITEREGDIEDSVKIIEQNIDWKIIKEELLYQIEKSGTNNWITLFNQRLEKLDEEFGLKSPIAREIKKLAEKEYEKLKK